MKEVGQAASGCIETFMVPVVIILSLASIATIATQFLAVPKQSTALVGAAMGLLASIGFRHTVPSTMGLLSLGPKGLTQLMDQYAHSLPSEAQVCISATTSILSLFTHSVTGITLCATVSSMFF